MPGEVLVTAAPHPFKVERRVMELPEGLTIDQMLDIAQPDPVLRRYAIAFIDGEVIPRDFWPSVRPKAGAHLELRVLPGFGGGEGGKNPLRTILTIAIIAASFYFGGPLGASIFGVPATTAVFGTITAGRIGSAIIGLAGMLLTNVIAPVRPPRLPQLSSISGIAQRDSPTLFIEGARNRARPFSPVPVVLGKHLMVPPLGAQSFTEVVGDKQFLRMVFVWGIGPLNIDMESFRIGETSISDFDKIEVETVDGFPASSIVELVTNGDFTVPTGWNLGAGWTIAGGEASSDGSQTTTSDLSQSIAILRGQHYRVEFRIVSQTSGAITPILAGNAGPSAVIEPPAVETKLVAKSAGSEELRSPTGGPGADVFITSRNGESINLSELRRGASEKYSAVFSAGSGGPPELVLRASEDFVGTIDDVSVKLNDKLTLYPDQVNQQNLSVLLKQTTGFVTRTSATDADELSVDVTFPRGLVRFNDSGGRDNRSVAIEIEFRKVGDVAFLTPAFTATTVSDAWVVDNTVTFTHNRTAAIRHSFRWPVTPRAQYEIRLRRTTADTTSSQIFDEVGWTALRTITNEDPIQSIVPVAKTALRIQATDQLNRVVDEFKGIVISIGKDWDGAAWIDDQLIQNPASLFRLALQGNGIADPLTDVRIDLTQLQDWHDFNVSKGFKFNMVRDFQSSVWDTLADISGAGRAAPTQVDGKWSVVIEEVQSVQVSHITPRNSFDFRVEKAFPDLPDGWRIRFPNEDQGWRQDERRVFRDGFSSANARKFESLDLPGVTDPDQIQRLGRFRIAQGILQPERWMFQQDMEYLTYRRGDRIAITHDVLLVGLDSGRIKAVTVDGSNAVTDLTLDEPVEMEAGKDYGVAIRTVAGGEITRQVDTNPGEQTQVILTTSIPATGGQPTVVAGEIFGFGLLGSEVDDASVIAIGPGSEFRSRIIAVPYRPAIFDADTEALPPFATNLTPLPIIPAPVVRGIVSDESVLAFGPADSLRTRIAIDLDPLTDPRLASPTIEIQGRITSTGEPFAPMIVDEQTQSRIIVSGVRDGERWDLRLRYRIEGLLLPGPWTTLSPHTVVGKATDPIGLTNLTISVFGGQALLRWDSPAELDVQFGGVVRFRHSPVFSGASWSQSTSIGELARARDLIATLPLKPGTYLARVFDIVGNPSGDIATVTTKQASVLSFASVDTLDEAPSFGGSHTGTVGLGGILKLNGSDPIDSWADVDAIADWDSEGGILSSGTYLFQLGFDFATVKRTRLTTRVTGQSTNVLELIDDRTDPIDEWEDFDGLEQGAADARVETRHTDDDPAGSPTWSAWERLDSAEFEARGFEFRALLTTNDPAINIHITQLGVDAEEVV